MREEETLGAGALTQLFPGAMNFLTHHRRRPCQGALSLEEGAGGGRPDQPPPSGHCDGEWSHTGPRCEERPAV